MHRSPEIRLLRRHVSAHRRLTWSAPLCRVGTTSPRSSCGLQRPRTPQQNAQLQVEKNAQLWMHVDTAIAPQPEHEPQLRRPGRPANPPSMFARPRPCASTWCWPDVLLTAEYLFPARAFGHGATAEPATTDTGSRQAVKRPTTTSETQTPQLPTPGRHRPRRLVRQGQASNRPLSAASACLLRTRQSRSNRQIAYSHTVPRAMIGSTRTNYALFPYVYSSDCSTRRPESHRCT